jgi:small redox-active disulfide protein 2
MMEIKVLGPGCVKCRGLEHRTRKAVAELGLDAQVSKVEDLIEMMNFGIVRTPALVINNEVVMSGKLPTYTELKTFLQDFKPN